MTDDFSVDPFEVWEQDHEFLFLPQDCSHEHTIGVDEGDGTYFTRCLDCGEEW